MTEPIGNTGKTAIGRFLDSLRDFPERPALEVGEEITTYRQLEEMARRISGRITLSGDDRPFVAVVADKSQDCYAAILGILMSGKGYLPLNPRFPESRNRFMMEKAGVAHFIQGGKLIRVDYPSVSGAVDAPAYLLFTSGTTGEPKGVQIPQSNLTAYLDFMLSKYEFLPDDRFTQNFDLTFDLSVHDLFLCWSSGACLCVPADSSSFAVAGFIREKKPTAWFSVPSVITLLDKMRLLKTNAFPSIRISFFCGEALYRQPLVSWRKAAPNSRAVNLYGPTEATIAISRYEVPRNEDAVKDHLGIISIGRIFDPQGYYIRPGSGPEQGELLLHGSQVIRNYFRNPLADQVSFVQIPGIEDPCYKTGDLVTKDSDGDLFYLGRTDSEVKISGYRVNLKEIENAIHGYEKVDHCVVLCLAGEDGQGSAAAFITWKGDTQAAHNELEAYCRQILPWYMVPGKLIFVDGFPLNDNGKIDKSALKEKYLDGK